MRFCFLLLVIPFLSGCYEKAVDAYCTARLAPTQLEVQAIADPVAERNTLDRNILTQNLGEGGPVVEGVAMGLTTASFQQQIDVSWQAVRGPGFLCARPTVHLRLRLKTPVVDVASDLAPGSCRYDLVRAHEQQHVQAYLDHLDASAVAVRQALDQRYPPAWFLRTATRAQFEQDRTRELDAWLAPLVSHLLAGVRARHQAIDIPAEYERLSRACSQEPLER